MTPSDEATMRQPLRSARRLAKRVYSHPAHQGGRSATADAGSPAGDQARSQGGWTTALSGRPTRSNRCAEACWRSA
jgi:hypothetical protein